MGIFLGFSVSNIFLVSGWGLIKILCRRLVNFQPGSQPGSLKNKGFSFGSLFGISIRRTGRRLLLWEWGAWVCLIAGYVEVEMLDGVAMVLYRRYKFELILLPRNFSKE